MGLFEKLGPSLTPLILKVLTVVMVIFGGGVVVLVLRFIIKWYRNRRNYKITAVIYNPDGSFYIDRIGKFKTSDGLDKMLFLYNPQETCPVIEPKYIINRTVTLYRYGVGQYAVVNPQIYKNLDIKKFGIELVNLQAKNFAFLEQRAAVSRWAYLKDSLEKWKPFIIIVVLAILTGVIAWFILKTALSAYESVVSARVSECRSLLGTQSMPTV